MPSLCHLVEDLIDEALVNFLRFSFTTIDQKLQEILHQFQNLSSEFDDEVELARWQGFMLSPLAEEIRHNQPSPSIKTIGRLRGNLPGSIWYGCAVAIKSFVMRC